MGDVFDRYLAILGGVADVLSVGSDNFGEFCLEGVDNISRFIEAQGGLGKVGNPFRIWDLQGCHFFHRGNHLSHLGSFAEGTLNLIMIAMPDQHQRIAATGKLDRLYVDLCHQRAGSVDHFEFAGLATCPHRRGNPVSAVNDPHSLRNIVDVIYKDGSFFSQLVDDKTVVDNLFAHVDTSAEGFERYVHHVDGAYHASTEAARFEKKNPLGRG